VFTGVKPLLSSGIREWCPRQDLNLYDIPEERRVNHLESPAVIDRLRRFVFSQKMAKQPRKFNKSVP
jgi:hypothetical protein